jgi:TRAP-type C4-dicarboxylate transport system permease small subunit
MIGYLELIAVAISLVLSIEFGRIAKSRGTSAWVWGTFVFVFLMVAAVLAIKLGEIWAYVVSVLVIIGGAIHCHFQVVRRPALDHWQDVEIPKIATFAVLTVPRFIIGVLILAGIAINFANVIGRYLFLAPVIWAEEIMIYIMVWTVFVGAVLVTWDGRHLKMDFFSIMLPSPWKETMNVTATIAFVVACIFVIPQNAVVVDMMQTNDQRSVVAEIPMVIPHFAILLGFGLMFFAILLRFRRHVTGDLDTEIDDLTAEFGLGAPDGEDSK